MDESRFDYANLANLSFIENLYEQYIKDPSSVDVSWRHFFEGMAFASSLKGIPSVSGGSSDLQVFDLIQAYREHGHKAASFNPIQLTPIRIEDVEELRLEKFGFSQNDLEQLVVTNGFIPEEKVPLKTLLSALQKTYCNTVGFEYIGIHSREMERWIEGQIEPFFHIPLSKEEKIGAMHSLNQAEMFESFIHMKYAGQKRFSLEGGETLIPMLKEIIGEGSEKGIQEMVLGMAHRGRLNVLANILGKPYSQIFQEFESGYVPDTFEGSGDVKYHKGYTAELDGGKGRRVFLSLAANPSHLESVDPVVAGITRAKQESIYHGDAHAILPILIHGDASVAGQGVVYETLQLSKLSGYSTGGTIHIVINNQVGFTAKPKETRSTRYCTDIAKAFGAPIFHVNGEDPSSCIAACKLAIHIRQKFGCDVFIDLNCYRKYGHNEADEPGFTQPLTYKLIQEKKGIRTLYREALIKEGTLTDLDAQKLEEEFKESLNQALSKTKEIVAKPREGSFQQLAEPPFEFKEIKTEVALEELKKEARLFCQIPEEFQVNPKLRRILEERLKALEGDPKAPVIDWGTAEHLAYASLLTVNIHIRLAGQDSGRGTFSHRHAIVTDVNSEKRYYPLSHLSKEQAPFDVYNSFLSEYAALGFEYGYSLAYKKALVIWEAQFGDFVNGAQIVIDQYIVSSKQKWGSSSSLTLFLPHGYEGQGPEHSSGRMERFLQLAANNSIIVANPTTSAQFFHLLRRQALADLQKPLIVFTPKHLLRYPPSLSAPNDFAQGTFQEVIEEEKVPSSIKRLLFCSGKVYYDLIIEREKKKDQTSSIIRIEQLYPFSAEKIKKMISKYKECKEYIWVQEEPENMGGWEYIRPNLQKQLPENHHLRYVGRVRSASTSAGSGALHKYELQQFLNKAFPNESRD